jgi:hypothetical protein
MIIKIRIKAFKMTKLQTGIFTATIFVSAVLLFLVQPMFAKMILPTLGGTAAVWTTCMLFFQATLLMGYMYAHLLTKHLPFKGQIACHLALVLLAFLQLPLPTPDVQASPTQPVLWLLTFAFTSIGLPFLILSASAPLLQSWFSRTHHPHGHNPYFLYAASNLGSMVALLGYPFGIEAIIGLTEQKHLWTLGFGALMGCLVFAAAIAFLQRNPHAHTEKTQGNSWSQRVFWMICAALPSSLMLGLTSFVSTDIAPISLFWVVPLALYLLTFIIVFGFGQRIPLKTIAGLALITAVSGIGVFLTAGSAWVSTYFYVLILFHVLVFFFIAWFFHGQLASSKPSATHLTDFYLWMSVGGMLGGVFNALVAPISFHMTLEYPLVFLVCAFLIYKFLRHHGWTSHVFNKEAVPLLPFVFVIGLGMEFMLSNIGETLYRDRSFYGSMAVKEIRQPETGTVVHLFAHGTTNHGAQIIKPETKQTIPMGYYQEEGLFGDVMKGYVSNNPEPTTVGITGLGAGGLSAFLRPQDSLTFYEIDPAVVAIAKNPDYFTYLKNAPKQTKIVLGDGRLSLKKTPDHHYDVLFADAFSSDAVPTNLITQEAIDLYIKKTKPTGAIAIHISNRYLDLQKVIANYTLPAGYASYCATYGMAEKETLANNFKYPHILCFIAREDSLPATIKTNPAWKRTIPDPTFRPWTDDYSNVFGVFKIAR